MQSQTHIGTTPADALKISKGGMQRHPGDLQNERRPSRQRDEGRKEVSRQWDTKFMDAVRELLYRELLYNYTVAYDRF